MIGLYAIAFLAPLLVFGLFGYFVISLQTDGKSVFASQRKALTIFVYYPIGFCYGLIVIAATWQFIQHLQQL